MKKLFLTLFFAAGIFLLWSHGEMLWGNRLFLDEPRVHKIEKGEYLSKLAQQYYGDPQRWRELALINRAPNPDHVEVGEDLLVPAANTISELGRARTITQVNALVDEQQKLATRGPSPSITQTTPATTPSSEVTSGNGTTPHEPVVERPTSVAPEPVATESGFPWLWVGVGAVMLALTGAGFEFYRRRQAANEKAEFTFKNPDDFRPRRYNGESASAKTESADQDEDAKEKDASLGESRHRRRFGESATAAV